MISNTFLLLLFILPTLASPQSQVLNKRQISGNAGIIPNPSSQLPPAANAPSQVIDEEMIFPGEEPISASPNLIPPAQPRLQQPPISPNQISPQNNIPPIQLSNVPNNIPPAIPRIQSSQAFRRPNSASQSIAPKITQFTSPSDETISLDAPDENASKLLSPGSSSKEDMPPSKIVAIFIAPALVFLLLIVAIWTLYRKGVISSCINSRKSKQNPGPQDSLKSNLAYPKMSRKAGPLKKSQDDIPEYSEWLESVHGTEDMDIQTIPQTRFLTNVSPSEDVKNENLNSLKIVTDDISLPTPALTSASHTAITINESDLQSPNGNYDNYQNTHILGTLQTKNTWKLGALKYTTREQLKQKQQSDDTSRINLASFSKDGSSSFWMNSKPSSESLSSSKSKSWWSRKSSNNLGKEPVSSNAFYDSFNVW